MKTDCWNSDKLDIEYLQDKDIDIGLTDEEYRELDFLMKLNGMRS